MRRAPLRSKAWRTNTAALSLILALGALPIQTPGAAAQTQVAADASNPSDFPSLPLKDDKIELSLEQAIQISLQRNLGLLVERYTRTQSRISIVQNLEIYDLLASVTATAEDSESPGISRVAGSKSDNQHLDFGLTQNLPTGGDLTFGWNNGRTATDSTFVSVPTSFGSSTSFTLRQPLLRGFGRLTTERNLLVAYNASNVARAEFERLVATNVQDVSNAYWNLVGARQQLIVAEQSLALARELHERNRIQVDVGTMPPLELVQSDAAIATREEDIIRATAGVGDAEDALRRLLNFPQGELWEKTIEPVTGPETDRIDINVNEAIQTALAERPEISGQELLVERAKLDATVLRLATKPGLDLTLRNTLDGQDERYRTAIDQIGRADFPGWSASLVFSVPIQNRGARARSAIANLELTKAEIALEQQKLIVSTEVRQAVRAVETAAKQIDAARKAREFQEKNLDAQRKRYENGMSTSFEITRVQDDLTQARSSEVNATIAYRTALINYYRTIGRLLEDENVVIDDPQDSFNRFGFTRIPIKGE